MENLAKSKFSYIANLFGEDQKRANIPRAQTPDSGKSIILINDKPQDIYLGMYFTKELPDKNNNKLEKASTTS